MKKKLIIVTLIVVMVVMFSFPASLFADNLYMVSVTKTATGFDSGNFTFEIQRYYYDYPDHQDGWETTYVGTINSNGGIWELSFYSSEVVTLRVKETGLNGATGVANSFTPSPSAIEGTVNDTTDGFDLTTDILTKRVYFDNIKSSNPTDGTGQNISASTTEPAWVRTMPMTCYMVWINKDNNFQFSFIYPYADNNWVRIYDMAGNMVYEIDMPYDNPNIIVDLPDGMYTVKTYHDQLEPIQTFVIGKP